MLRRPQKDALLGAALLFLLTFAAYAPVVRAGFIWDDDRYPANPVLSQPDALRRVWSVNQTDQYYPLTFTTFWAERRAWGQRPMGFHIVNVLLHAMNALLLWFLLKKLRVPGAWFAAAIFALHPVNVESVAWIAERKNVLSGFFYLLALASYLRFDDGEGPAWYGAALAAFLAALLSKTVTCTLPAALLIARWFRGRAIDRRSIRNVLPFFALGAALAAVTSWVEAHHVGANGPEFSLSISQRALLAGRALWFYAGKLVWPANLTFNYARWTLDPSNPFQWLWTLAAAAAAAGAWLLREKIGRGLAAGLAFFAVTLSPALGFFNVYPQRYSFVADHFQYLASSGFIAMAVGGACCVFGGAGTERWRFPIKNILAAAVLAFLGWSTWRQSRTYRDDETLWRDVLSKNPSSILANQNVGASLTGQGKTDQAIAFLDQALAAKPDYAEAHYDLGLALTRQGKSDEAIRQYGLAIQANPRFAEAHDNLAALLIGKGKIDEAIRHYNLALAAKPSFVGVHYNLGVVLAGQGKVDEAIKHFNLALIRTKPEWAKAQYNLGLAFARQGNWDEAIRQYGLAIQANPNLAEAHNNLGAALSGQGKLDEAIQQYRLAIQASSSYADAHYNLGNLLARQGKVDEAIEQYNQAIKANPQSAEARNNLTILERLEQK